MWVLVLLYFHALAKNSWKFGLTCGALILACLQLAVELTAAASKVEAASHWSWNFLKVKNSFSLCFALFPDPLPPPDPPHKKKKISCLCSVFTVFWMSHCFARKLQVLHPSSQPCSFLHPNYQKLDGSLPWQLKLLLFLGAGCVCDLLTHSSSQAVWSSD